MKEEIQKVREALKAVAVTSGNSEPYAAFNLIAARIEEMENARLRGILDFVDSAAALQSQEKADG